MGRGIQLMSRNEVERTLPNDSWMGNMAPGITRLDPVANRTRSKTFATEEEAKMKKCGRAVYLLQHAYEMNAALRIESRASDNRPINEHLK
jgi:hypothetical protein